MNRLTTGNTFAVHELLKDLPRGATLLVLISIRLRNRRSGLLEERGSWIEQLWSRILGEFPNVVGCRVLWDTVFFAFPATMESENVEVALQRHLSALKESELKSICITRISNSEANKIIKDLDEMQQETSSELDLGKLSNIRSRIIDGVKNC